MSPFNAWLREQRTRSDAVGQLARAVVAKKVLLPPESWRLHILLAAVRDPQLRVSLKRAHREWRRAA